ncbi:hypothetical protein L0128_16345 [candidate division KSB1 bacterium]|nr:hypothetical protein [candidate division KSB1 bacterium]
MNFYLKQSKLMAMFSGLLLLTISVGFASGPQMKVYKDVNDFKNGNCHQLTLSNPGFLSLASRTLSFFDSTEPFVWAWGQDSKGNTYLGTGNDGKVFKITPQKTSTVFFDAAELEIFALALDRLDNLYAATSPEGKIYKITPTGNVTTYFDPTDNYIWDLAFDAQGVLYAATGDSSRIYKITASGKGEVVLKTNESHITEMAFTTGGVLLAGTVDNGYLYRLDPNGKIRVLFDSGYREIHSLSVANDGTIYLGAYGQKTAGRVVPAARPKETTEKPTAKSETPEKTEEELEEIQIVAEPVEAEMMPMPRSGKSAVFRLTPDGASQNIWRLKEEVYALSLNPDQTLLVGTGGNEGKLYRLNQDAEESLLLTVSDGQITALHQNAQHHVFLCTSNMGKVLEMSPLFETEGSYESEVLNAGLIANWGNLRWEAEVPPPTKLEFFTRTGNTQETNTLWSDWAGPYTRPEGEAIKSPPAQFLQWKARFRTTDAKNTPRLDEVVVAYLQQNVTPQLSRVTVDSPERFLTSQADDSPDYYADDPSGEPTSKSDKSPMEVLRRRETNMRTIRWSAKDDNGDPLQFNLFYKGVTETTWRELTKALTQSRYRWNSELWPDGSYQIRIEATDASVNPATSAKSVTKISDRFLVDNTGPEVVDFKITRASQTAAIFQFSIQDRWIQIYSTEYVLDSGDWQAIFPDDGICDAPRENFRLELATLAPGDHTLVIRTFDRFSNIGFGKFAFKIE